MAKRTGPTNPKTKQAVASLMAASQKNDAKIWRSVAERILRPSRIMACVNVSKIEKYAKDKESVIIPGKLIADGEIKKKITVSALRASAGAVEKIEKAGGKYITIEEMIKDNPKGKNTRIMA